MLASRVQNVFALRVLCASPSVLFLGCLRHMGSGLYLPGSPSLGAALSSLGLVCSNLPFLFCIIKGLFKVFTDSRVVSPGCFLKALLFHCLH